MGPRPGSDQLKADRRRVALAALQLRADALLKKHPTDSALRRLAAAIADGTLAEIEWDRARAYLAQRERGVRRVLHPEDLPRSVTARARLGCLSRRALKLGRRVGSRSPRPRHRSRALCAHGPPARPARPDDDPELAALEAVAL